MMRALTRRVMPLAFSVLLVACAAQRPPPTDANSWSGRLAVQVDGPSPQSFSAGFDLTGSPEAGELVLSSPLGNTLATVRWSPGGAEMQQGSLITRRPNLDQLTTELGGTPLPVAALFAWMRGQPLMAQGWEADLSQQPQGRISARRILPEPPAQLRLVFQP